MLLLICVLCLCQAQALAQGRFLNIYSTNYHGDDYCLLRYEREGSLTGKQSTSKKNGRFSRMVDSNTHTIYPRGNSRDFSCEAPWSSAKPREVLWSLLKSFEIV
jgi:hypothetical protein